MTDCFNNDKSGKDHSGPPAGKAILQIKQAWNALGIVKASIFLILLNIGFGALLKAWIRGTADKYDVLGLVLLLVPMLIIYGLIPGYAWQIIRSGNVKLSVKIAMYLILATLVVSFLGGFFINVNF